MYIYLSTLFTTEVEWFGVEVGNGSVGLPAEHWV
jgi:hypothetical protein